MIQHWDSVSGPDRRKVLGGLAAGSLWLSARGLEVLWANTPPNATDSRLVVGELKSWRAHPQLQRLEVAFRFLERADLKTLPAGKHVIDTKAYALVDKSPTLPLEKSEVDAHRKYIEVVYV